MPCTPSLFAFAKPCSSVMGGIVAVYVADPAKITATVTVAAGTVALAPVTQNAKPFYKWETVENRTSLDGTAQVSDANNTSFFQYVLNTVLQGFYPTTAGANLLGRLTRRLAVVVEYRDGSFGFLGMQSADKLVGAKLTEAVISSGTQRGDNRGATFTFQLDSTIMAPSVSGTFQDLVNS